MGVGTNGRKHFYDPSILEGWGAQWSGGKSLGIGIEGGVWGSFNDYESAKNGNLGKATFMGWYKGVTAGASARFKKTPTPSSGTSGSFGVSNSTLIQPSH